MGEHKHSRQITEGDGVSDDVAVLWSDYEDARRAWGLHGSHRAAEHYSGMFAVVDTRTGDVRYLYADRETAERVAEKQDSLIAR